MKRIATIFFLTICFFEHSYTQSNWCGFISTSSSTSYIYIPADSVSMVIDNKPMEYGSYIIAMIWKSGSWQCAGQVQWNGVNAILQVRGMDGNYIGYNAGDTIKLFVEEPSGCIIKNVQAEFDQNNSKYPGKGIFGFSSKSLLRRLHGQKRGMTSALIQNDTCSMHNGSIEIKDVSGFKVDKVIWKDGSNSNPYTKLKSDTYIATVSDVTGCSQIDTFKIVEAKCPELTAIINANNSNLSLTDCSPFKVQFADSSKSSSGIKSRIWSFGVNQKIDTSRDPIFIYTSPGNYVVKLKVNDGFREDSTTFTINVVNGPNEPFVPNDTVVCSQKSFVLSANNNCNLCNYSWSNGGKTAEITVSQEGLYVVTISTSSNCTLTDSIIIKFSTSLGQAMQDTVIQKGETCTLRAWGGLSYKWSSINYPVSNEQSSNPTAMPLETTEYSVVIIDSNGCHTTKTIKVIVNTNPGGPPPLDLFFPNILTLNDDGKNDKLLFDFSSIHKTKELYVCNRWGNLVYKNIEYNNEWDGTQNGEKLIPDTYYYILIVNGQSQKSILYISN